VSTDFLQFFFDKNFLGGLGHIVENIADITVTSQAGPKMQWAENPLPCFIESDRYLRAQWGKMFKINSERRTPL
jgi:hypothetical protein